MWKYLCFTFSLLCSNQLHAQLYDQKLTDSLVEVTCKVLDADQHVRTNKISKQIQRHIKSGDKQTTDSMINWRKSVDSQNIHTLVAITRQYGYPFRRVLGRENVKCPMGGIVMIHWSKTWPHWFNDEEIVALFKQDVEKGNLPLCDIDMAHFLYVSFLKPTDMNIIDKLNNARKAYGLKEYTLGQCAGAEPITPIMKPND